MSDRYFTDEELVAYLDGEEDFAPSAEIARALAVDFTLATRIEALKIDREALINGFDGLIAAPPEIPVLKAAAPSTRSSVPAMAAAAILALFVGFGAGQFTSQPAQANWKTYVAAYQALYTNSTLAHVNRDDSQKRQELERVSASIGKDIELAKMQVSPELDYKRAQILGFKGKALIQLAFLNSTGEPIALCIIRARDGIAEKIQSEVIEGLSASAWAQDGYEFFLIGGTDQPFITRLAETFQRARL